MGALRAVFTSAQGIALTATAAGKLWERIGLKAQLDYADLAAHVEAEGAGLKPQTLIDHYLAGAVVGLTLPQSSARAKLDTDGRKAFSAQLITDDPAALNAALREAPVEPGIILGADLALYDSGGTLIDSFHFTGADFTETPLGFELNVENVSGLDIYAGQSNTAELTIDFDQNGDLIADSSVTLNVEIEGVLPHSYDA